MGKAQIENLDNDVVSCFKYYDEANMLKDVFNLFTFNANTRADMEELFRERRVSKKADTLKLSSLSALNEVDGDLAQTCITLSRFAFKDFAKIVVKSTGTAEL